MSRDSVSLADAMTAPRAVVVLKVPWSIQAVRARHAVTEAVPDLEALGLTVLLADEEASEVREWVDGLGVDYLAGFARGAGTGLWLEKGSIVHCSHEGGRLTAEQIVERARTLWP